MISDAYDFGVGAGFYLDATQAPWSQHYRMYRYVIDGAAGASSRRSFPADTARSGIIGHSMGGHGALTIGAAGIREVPLAVGVRADRRADAGARGARRRSRATSARTARHGRSTTPPSWWRTAGTFPDVILVDQGLADKFLDAQLKPELLRRPAKAAGQPLDLRMHHGYDHGYFFIQTFMRDTSTGTRGARRLTGIFSRRDARATCSSSPLRTVGSGSRYLRRIAGR